MKFMKTLLTLMMAVTFLKFTLPVKSKEEWIACNSELKILLDPIHHDLATDVISPSEAGDKIGLTIQNFLLSKPEFNEERKSSTYIKHDSKALNQVKTIKNQLRKSARNSQDPEERKQFYQAIRAHSYLNKQQRKKDKDKSAAWQESIYRKNFFEFSKSVCNDTLGKSSPQPSFSKSKADDFYKTRYSQKTTFDTNNLGWYPRLETPENLTQFVMDPFTPKAIKKLLKSKSNNSSPGPDGITYGILKKLPVTHHILATLYSKLLHSPTPPSSWGKSKITLIYKKGESDDPRNFRMIALSSVLGKTFHLLLAHRISSYLTSNNFIDKSTQKAFLSKVNGVLEHNQTLHEILDHAKLNKRTVHSTFFDLEDAFGSVDHKLISYSLLRYKIPIEIHSYIMNLYSTLKGTVVTKDWSSEEFTFNKGVFQGDPLSPVIFLLIFNPLLEKLKLELQHGYEINNIRYITTPFADDFNLLTKNKKTHQRIINNLQYWTTSMGLKLKPSKCKSLSIVGGKPQSVMFNLADDVLDTLENEPHKFLGSTLTFQNKQSDIYDIVHEHFETRLQRIDDLLIRNEFKIRIYKDYLLPSSKFTLTVHSLSQTSLKKLDDLTTRYLKRWVDLPQSATRAILHSQQFLAIKTISHIYRESQSTAFISSKLQADSNVQNVLESRLERESQWIRKRSTIVESENLFQKIVENTPEISKVEIIKKKAKTEINEEMKDHWNNHLKSLVLQGAFLSADDCLSDINYKSILFNLPRNVLKFLSNACIDTLPTNNNLKKWNKRKSDSCNLCGNKETLLHVLNFCNVMLDQGRYTWRHNSALNAIHSTLQSKLHHPSQFEITCDLPDSMFGISTVPTDILVTTQKPDLVIVDRALKRIILIELTVPFDINISSAHERKTKRYENLISDLNTAGYKASCLAIEIGARGFISKDNQKRIIDMLNFCGISMHRKDLNIFIDNLKKL